MIITAQWLKEIGACSWREFEQAYPNGSPRAYEAALKAAICDAYKWDWDWVAERLPATARKAYDEAMATAFVNAAFGKYAK